MFRVYCCDSIRLKRDWIDNIGDAKRKMLHDNLSALHASIRGKLRDNEQPESTVERSTLGTESVQEGKTPDESAWLAELPAELDDCMAPRDLEQAVSSLFENFRLKFNLLEK